MELTNCTISPGVKLGWVDQPLRRGTLDILWSCLLVIVTSIWTVLHINLPGPEETYWSGVARKARWALFALFAPELVSVSAASQWYSARTSAEKMKDLGVDHWTVVHGFFSDSGGFLLCPPDLAPFPINTRAMLYLVRKKYITAPSITRDEIWDRSKADYFVKIVACVQSGYMVIQCIARRVQSLEISCLELSTVAFVMCTAISYFFWIDKPLNVTKAISIKMETPMATVLLEAGTDAANPYEDTPMDFVEKPGWKLWRRRRMFSHFGLQQRPLQRIPDDYMAPPPTITMNIFLWLEVSVFGIIHVLGWNFPFPTLIDLWIWRLSSLLTCVILSGWGIVLSVAVVSGLNFDMALLGIWVQKSTKDTFFRRWAIDGPGSVSAMVYFVARLLLIGETFASLRYMESTAYSTVSWTNFIPHL